MKTIKGIIVIIALLGIVIIAKGNTTESTTSNVDLFMADQETEIQIERWMTSDFAWDSEEAKMNHFAANFKKDHAKMHNVEMKRPVIHINNDQEEDLNVESWMTDDTTWNSKTKETYNETIETVEEESELAIENWMTNDVTWGVYAIDTNTENDSDLALESWMLDDNYWR